MKGNYMQVWQIVGLSFSGSTILGNILNAHEGCFFGSEVYRLLPPNTGEGMKAGCSSCGPRCVYWTHELKQRITNLSPPQLSNVYEAFEHAHPSTKVFIDGSKSLGKYQNDWRDWQLVTVKHPLRMVSSNLYNRSDLLGLPLDTPFKQFLAATTTQPSPFMTRSNDILAMILRVYRNILKTTPRRILVRTDTLKDHDFSEYEALCDALSIAPTKEHVTNFTAKDVHPIGGNKALVWLRRDRQGKQVTPAVHDRANYYVEPSTADYRVDDKHKHLIAPELRDYIYAQGAYRELCDLLGYPHQIH